MINRLALIAVAGFAALALAACGEQSNTRPVAGASDNPAVSHPQEPTPVTPEQMQQPQEQQPTGEQNQ